MSPSETESEIGPEENVGDLRQEIADVLPFDLPQRVEVIEIAARHAEQMLEVNRVMNLTSITAPREVAIKHVLDSVVPWRLLEKSQSVLDIGSGAGYPGIPLAAIFPDKLFILSESTRKKAAFLADVVKALELENVAVIAERAETVLREESIDTAVGRAVGSAAKILRVLSPAQGRFNRLLLYKGPNAQAELEEATPEAFHARVVGRISLEYELPHGLGQRTVLEYTSRV